MKQGSVFGTVLSMFSSRAWIDPRGAGFSKLASCQQRTESGSRNFLIGHLLDDGCVHEASRICRYFHFYNQDVALALHCRALASGEASVDDMHPEMGALLRSAELLEEEEETGIPLRKVQSSK